MNEAEPMWFPIFIVGLAVIVYKTLREPIWGAIGAAYVYFAIPHLEFQAPMAPYQAAFWALAALGSFRYYGERERWGQRSLEKRGLDAARCAVDAVRAEMKSALALAATQGVMPGELERAMLEAGEARAMAEVDARAPKAIAVAIRRAVLTSLKQGAEHAEREALAIIEKAGGSPRGHLRAAVEAHAFPAFDRELERHVTRCAHERVAEAIEAWSGDRRRSVHEGALGMPLNNGPLAGLAKNAGFWLHLAFIVLTWHGVSIAVYDRVEPVLRLEVAKLLLIPMVALVLSVRNEEHFKLFTYAWMAGVLHLALNGVTYWLQYGGRADNAGGQGGESNFLAAVIVTVAPVAFSMAINMPTWLERLVGLGVAGLYTLGVLASGSRAGLLALLGAMGYWLLHTRRKGVALGLAMLAAAGFLVAAPESFWEKMGTIVGEKDKNPWVRNAVEPSKNERLVLWGLAWRLYQDNPVWGIGPLNFPKVSAEETDFTDPYMGQRGLQAHSTWLQLLAEYGTVGGVVWIGAFLLALLCFRFARQSIRGQQGYEWFSAMCLGFESGAIASAVMLSFNSFQWYDYIYWHIVFGPLAFEVARKLKARLDWLKPGEPTAGAKLPPPRYGPPRSAGLELDGMDLGEQVSSAGR